MAIDRLVPVRVTLAGLQIAGDGSLSNADTFKFRNNGRVILEVVNGAVISNLTFDIVRNVGDESLPDRTVNIPATQTRYIGPFPPSVYNNGEGDVVFTIDDTSNLTIKAIEVS